MEIKIIKTVTKGRVSWEMMLEGLLFSSMYAGSCQEMSRGLTGTTGEESNGVFTGLAKDANISMTYGDYEKTFEFPRVFGRTIEEAASAFRSRVRMVREWVATLPKDHTESVQFDL